MNELKFRAWVNETINYDGKLIKKGMHTVTGVHFFEGQELTSVSIDAMGVGEIQDIWLEGKPIKLMKFTGLKDCNGVDIYEGDIIESGVSKELSLKGHRGYVVFEDASFTVERRQHKVPYNHDKYLPYLDWPCEAFESCKVIGNVFEDGELLKE